MKNMFIYFFSMFYGLFISCTVLGAPGCLDNSTSLSTLYDYKEYHVVACNCPCSQYKLRADRGQCVKCQHFHDVKPVYTVARQEFYKQAAAVRQAVEKRIQNTKSDNPFARTFNAYPLIN